MRYVIVPPAVILEDLEGKEIPLRFGDGGSVSAGTPWTMMMYAQYFVFPDTRLGADAKAAKSSKRLRKALRGCKAGDVLALEEADWSLLRDVVEKPTNPLSGLLAAQLSDFMQAVIEAKDEAPTKAANGAAIAEAPAPTVPAVPSA